MAIGRFLGLLDVVHLLFQKKVKVNDYTCYESGSDFIFEPIDDGRKGYMTGQGKDVHANEYIALRDGTKVEYYRVETIDYYSNPSDMWIALLSKVNSQP
jgi:MioC protein